MTAQGERYGRYVGWVGSDAGTYDGNQIAAAESITGETGLTQDAALHRICASLSSATTPFYDTKKPLLDYMAEAAAAVGVDVWTAVGNELPAVKPTWPPA